MTIEELRVKIKYELSHAPNYFPDDTSKREGYIAAMEEVLFWLDGPSDLENKVPKQARRA